MMAKNKMIALTSLIMCDFK